MCNVCEKFFKTPILDIPDDAIIEHPPPLLWGDFINSSVPKENRQYAEIPDLNKLAVVLKVSVSISINHFTIRSDITYFNQSNFCMK